MKKYLAFFSVLILAACSTIWPPYKEDVYSYQPLDLTQGNVHKISFTPKNHRKVFFDLDLTTQYDLQIRWAIKSPSRVVESGVADVKDKGYIQRFATLEPLPNLPYVLELQVSRSSSAINKADPRIKIYSPEQFGSKDK